jgi:hypothetical protein
VFGLRKACSRTWRRGSAEDCARIFGGRGGTGTPASTNCAVVAYRSSMQRSPPVRRPVSGACPDIRRSKGPCATTILIHSVSPDSMTPCLCLSLTQSNRRGTRPVCPVVWEGGTARCPPIPINAHYQRFGIGKSRSLERGIAVSEAIAQLSEAGGHLNSSTQISVETCQYRPQCLHRVEFRP